MAKRFLRIRILIFGAICSFFSLNIGFPASVYGQGIDFARTGDFGNVIIHLETNGLRFEPKIINVTWSPSVYPKATLQAEKILEKYIKKNKDPFPKILKDLERGWKAKANALAALGKLGEASLPYLEKIILFLEDKNQAVRFNAFWALIQVAPNNSQTPQLLTSFYSQNKDLHATQTLGLLRPFKEHLGKIKDQILETAIKNDGLIIVYAKEILEFQNAHYEEAIIKYLNHQNERFKKNALVFAISLKDQDRSLFIPEFIRLLTDKNHEIRWLSAYALGQVGAVVREAIPVLKEMGSSENKKERQAALITLKKMGFYKTPSDGDQNSPEKISREEIFANLKSPLKEKVAVGLLAFKALPKEEKILHLDKLFLVLGAGTTNNDRGVMAILIDLKEKASPAIPHLIRLFKMAKTKGRFKQQKDILKTLPHLSVGQGQVVPFLVEIYEENDPRLLPLLFPLTAVIGPDAAPTLPYLKSFLNDTLIAWEKNKNPSKESQKIVQIIFVAFGAIGNPDQETIKFLETFSKIESPGYSRMANKILKDLKLSSGNQK